MGAQGCASAPLAGKIVKMRTSDIEMSFRSGEFAGLAFDLAPIGLVVTENRVIRGCNAAFAGMFQYAPEDLKDRSFAMLYPSREEFVNIRDAGVKDLSQTRPYQDERIMARRDGSLFWVRVRGRSLTPEDPLARAVWSFADLSETRPCKPLTKRERQIAMHLGEGRTSKEMAQLLDVSPRTVEVYRARLLKKFNVANTAALLLQLGGMPGAGPGGRPGAG